MAIGLAAAKVSLGLTIRTVALNSRETLQTRPNFAWGLFRVGETGDPIQPRIGGLHESVLETDPTGREKRPRNPAS
jgi:hypothetical protein